MGSVELRLLLIPAHGSLDDINNLDEWIARSLVILLFASDKYFTSWSCQNEIKSTLKWKRPFFIVHEADPKHGGKPWADLVAECPVKLEASGRFGALPDEYLTAQGEGDVKRWAREGWFARATEAPTRTVQLDFAQLIFDGQEPIMWHRLPGEPSGSEPNTTAAHHSFPHPPG